MNSPKGVELAAGSLLVSDYDGMPGSGKTTITTRLSDVLPNLPSINMPKVVTEAGSLNSPRAKQPVIRY